VRHDRWYLVLLAAQLAAMAAIADPRGNFPLNDDWSYAWTVKVLAEEGRLVFTNWVSMPLIAQIGWGWLFTLPAGFSFEALRGATLVLSFLGAVGLYFLVRTGARPVIAWIAAAALLATPIHFHLSLSFMTDVPATALMLLALASFGRDLAARDARFYWPAIACTFAAVLTRQLALAVPLAYAIAALWLYRPTSATLARALLPLALAILAYGLYTAALGLDQPVPQLYALQSDRLWQALADPATAFPQLLFNLGGGATTLGLLLLPVLAFAAPGIAAALREAHPRPGLLIGFNAVLAAAPVVAFAATMPILGNILIDVGLGPLTLRDTYLLKLEHWPRMPEAAGYTVTAIGLLGWGTLAAVFATTLGGAWRSLDRTRPAVVLLAVFLVVYALPLLLTTLFDRYLLPAVGAAIALVALTASDRRRSTLATVTGAVLLLAYAAYSVAASHDYFAWNRARWSALDALERFGVAPTSIDGGFEYNAWRLHDKTAADPRNPARSWWWVVDDRYLVTLGPVPGHVERARQTFMRWLPPGEGTVLVLERAGAPPRSPVSP